MNKTRKRRRNCEFDVGMGERLSCQLWCCCCCCLNCFCYLGSERLPAFDHLFVRLPSLCLGVLFALHSFVYSFLCLSLSCYCCAGDIHLLFKLLFKFPNVLKHTESRNSFACDQNVKEDIPTDIVGGFPLL